MAAAIIAGLVAIKAGVWVTVAADQGLTVTFDPLVYVDADSGTTVTF